MPISSKNNTPLAEQLRPQTLDDFIGQTHLLGENAPLRLAVQAKRIPSMILWGPPGVGKTTLALLLAKSVDAVFIKLSAVMAGLKEVREAFALAKTSQEHDKNTILFVDEVHRFNKTQQDAFLPHIESGLITFIGATTENPSFEMQSALLSRLEVFILEPLSPIELATILERAIQEAMPTTVVDEAGKDFLIASADGDARTLINFVELLSLTRQSMLRLTEIESLVTKSLRRFDKRGEQFYDQISALHKAVRGSNPDAALYWFCRMIDGGADPLYIGRRLVRMASEDIGLADPRSLEIALAAFDAYDRLGSPEGELALVQALLYLAAAPKSNAAYRAYQDAMRWVKEDGTRPVPLHLRNAPTRLMKRLGYGKGYRYAHDEPFHFSPGQSYFPDHMPHKQFYWPSQEGVESRIAERLKKLRELEEKIHD
jgi:putative ATPase